MTTFATECPKCQSSRVTRYPDNSQRCAKCDHRWNLNETATAVAAEAEITSGNPEPTVDELSE